MTWGGMKQISYIDFVLPYEAGSQATLWSAHNVNRIIQFLILSNLINTTPIVSALCNLELLELVLETWTQRAFLLAVAMRRQNIQNVDRQKKVN